MEPAGLVVGIAGLAGAFGACMYCFDYIQRGCRYEGDYEMCLLRLSAAKHRMYRWGTATGLTQDIELKHQAHFSNQDSELVQGLLEQIVYRFKDAEKLSDRFKTSSNKGNNGEHNAKHSANSDENTHGKTPDMVTGKVQSQQRTRGTVWKKTAWALYGKEFDRLIKDVARLVNDLVELFPAALENLGAYCKVEASGDGEIQGLALEHETAVGDSTDPSYEVEDIERQGLMNDEECLNVGGHARIVDPSFLDNANPSASTYFNKHFMVPRNPSPSFTGRNEINDLLRSQRLSSPTPLHTSQRQKRFVIHGLGGAGKTQVCLKFVEDYRERFWGVFWVDASNTESLERDYQRIAAVCDWESHVEAVKRQLSNASQPWALVFDNANDPRLNLSPFFPVGNRGIVLITTRNPNLQMHATVGSYKVGGLAVDESVALLFKTAAIPPIRQSTSLREIARSIVLGLECLALAIIQAGGAIRQGYCSIEEYPALYSKDRKKLLTYKDVRDFDDYRYTVYTTWETSWGMMSAMGTEAAQDAQGLFQIFGFMHHSRISEGIFCQAGEKEPCIPDWRLSNLSDRALRLYHRKRDVSAFRAAMSILQLFSLISRDDDDLNYVHPLVHAWTRDRLTQSGAETLWELAISRMNLAISSLSESADYNLRKLLLPHVDNCLGARSDGVFHLHRWGTLCSEMAYNFASIYIDLGRQQKASRILEQLVEMKKLDAGTESQEYLVSMHRLSICYCQLNRPQEAMHLIKQVVKAFTKSLGDEHSLTLESRRSLAEVYFKLGRHRKAPRLLEGVVDAQRRTLGKEDPRTLSSMLVLSWQYLGIRQQHEAMNLTRFVLYASIRVLGKDHPITLSSMECLARLRIKAGRRGEALQIMQLVVQGRGRAFGDDDECTLEAVQTLERWTLRQRGSLKKPKKA